MTQNAQAGSSPPAGDIAAALGVSTATLEIMQRALTLQMDAQFPEAKLLYEQALADGGNNYNVLNMLALVEYNLGNLDRAETLAADAVRLAPGFAAAQKNQRIITAARRVRACRPFIFDPLVDRHPPADGATPLVHLYKIAGNQAGGTEWRCIDLARRLRRDATVVLWTEDHSLAKVFTKDNQVHVVDASRGAVPQGEPWLSSGPTTGSKNGMRLPVFAGLFSYTTLSIQWEPRRFSSNSASRRNRRLS